MKPTRTDSQRVKAPSKMTFVGEERRAFSQQAITQMRTIVPIYSVGAGWIEYIDKDHRIHICTYHWNDHQLRVAVSETLWRSMKAQQADETESNEQLNLKRERKISLSRERRTGGPCKILQMFVFFTQSLPIRIQTMGESPLELGWSGLVSDVCIRQ